eukprot:7293298-Prymnesium_polylepis.2
MRDPRRRTPHKLLCSAARKLTSACLWDQTDRGRALSCPDAPDHAQFESLKKSYAVDPPTLQNKGTATLTDLTQRVGKLTMHQASGHRGRGVCLASVIHVKVYDGRRTAPPWLAAPACGRARR